MKLYAITTSERGKPVGKGGNKTLKTDLFIGSAAASRLVASMTAEVDIIGKTATIIIKLAREGLFDKLETYQVGFETIKLSQNVKE